MKISEYLLKFVGRPYIWGGDGSGKCHGGFDCSGLVLEGLWALGLYKGKDATAQSLYQSLLAAGWALVPQFPGIQRAEGDVIFFGKNSTEITHVAVALDSKLMVEAGGGGSKCKSPETSTGLVRVRPVSSRSDLIAALRLI